MNILIGVLSVSSQEQLIVAGWWGCEGKYVLLVSCVACLPPLLTPKLSYRLARRNFVADRVKSRGPPVTTPLTIKSPPKCTAATGQTILVVVFKVPGNMYLINCASFEEICLCCLAPYQYDDWLAFLHLFAPTIYNFPNHFRASYIPSLYFQIH